MVKDTKELTIMKFGQQDLINMDKQMCFALYNANKQFNHFYSEVLEQFNLTYPQYLVLSSLWDNNDAMTVRQLGQVARLDGGTLTPLLKRLENHGWVVRSKAPNDNRHVLISLSAYAIEQKCDIVNLIQTKLNHLNMTDQEYRERVQEVNDISHRLEQILTTF